MPVRLETVDHVVGGVGEQGVIVLRIDVRRGDRGARRAVALCAVSFLGCLPVGGIVAVAVQSAVDFSLQMPGNAALFATLCGVALHEERDRSG